jgi:hypothetical protein
MTFLGAEVPSTISQLRSPDTKGLAANQTFAKHMTDLGRL